MPPSKYSVAAFPMARVPRPVTTPAITQPGPGITLASSLARKRRAMLPAMVVSSSRAWLTESVSP